MIILCNSVCHSSVFSSNILKPICFPSYVLLTIEVDLTSLQEQSSFTSKLHIPQTSLWDFSQLLLVMLLRWKPLKISNLSQFSLLMNNSLCDPVLVSGWCSMHFNSHNYFSWWWKDWINMIKLKENSWALKLFQAT